MKRKELEYEKLYNDAERFVTELKNIYNECLKKIDDCSKNDFELVFDNGGDSGNVVGMSDDIRRITITNPMIKFKSDTDDVYYSLTEKGFKFSNESFVISMSWLQALLRNDDFYFNIDILDKEINPDCQDVCFNISRKESKINDLKNDPHLSFIGSDKKYSFSQINYCSGKYTTEFFNAFIKLYNQVLKSLENDIFALSVTLSEPILTTDEILLNNFVNDIRKYQLIQVQSYANLDESVFGDKIAFPKQEVTLISISKFERMVNDMGLKCFISHDNGTSISLINEPTKKYNR